MEWNVLKQYFDQKANIIIIWLNDEYSKIRSGRVNLAIFNNIRVEAYGEMMPLNQVGNVQLLDARTVVVKLYDQSQSKAVVSALAIANLGVNPVADSNGVKMSFPPITEETRKVNVKKCKEVMEQGKVRIRQVREEVKNMWKKETNLPEDVARSFEDELNKITKFYNTKLEELFTKKEQELLKI